MLLCTSYDRYFVHNLCISRDEAPTMMCNIKSNERPAVESSQEPGNLSNCKSSSRARGPRIPQFG